MESMIYEFITIPSWGVSGMVIDERPATIGGDNAREFLVQYNPNHEGEWFRLEPGEYTVE